jgi:hypothetical protein
MSALWWVQRRLVWLLALPAVLPTLALLALAWRGLKSSGPPRLFLSDLLRR